MKNNWLFIIITILAVAAAVFFCNSTKEPPVKKAEVVEPEAPDVWVGPDCEPQIVTVPVEKIVKKTVYVNKPLETGCHVNPKTGKVFGVIAMDSPYRLECYVHPNGTVKAKYVQRGAELLRD